MKLSLTPPDFTGVNLMEDNPVLHEIHTCT